MLSWTFLSLLLCLFCFCVGCVLAANFSASSCFDSIALALAKVTVVEGKKEACAVVHNVVHYNNCYYYY